MAHTFNLAVENDDEGMWHVSSSDAVPGAGLLIVERSLQEALAEVPKAMDDLQRALKG